jgi:hypothetical protein
MARRRTIALGFLAAIAVIGCDAGPRPTTPAAGETAATTTPAADRSAAADSGIGAADELGGPWLSAPVPLDDAHIAIVSDACAAEARARLSEADADLPTALVDARGEHVVTVIMADDLNAVLCLARLSDDEMSATVDSVDRLSAIAVAPVEKTAISVASVIPGDDPANDRTLAFGRIGPDAHAAKAGLGDNSTILASSAEGWWALWWLGSVRATSFSAVDSHDLVIGSAVAPAGQVEARVGPAQWWIDPTAGAPTPASRTIHALVLEQACASGDTPQGRVEPPAIELADTTITVTFSIRHKVDGQDCHGNPPFAVELKLPEPLGNRKLLDGSATPPRDATTVPAG